MLAKFQEDQKSITMLLKKNVKILSFCDLKLCIKNNFIDRIVNNIQFEQNLICKIHTKIRDI